MNFTPLDILYLVLAFCALWLTAALFWLIWQLGSILRAVNDTLETVQEKIARIESAITAIKSRFESVTAASGLLIEGVKKVIEFAVEKREEFMQSRRAAPVRRKVKQITNEEMEDES